MLEGDSRTGVGVGKVESVVLGWTSETDAEWNWWLINMLIKFSVKIILSLI